MRIRELKIKAFGGLENFHLSFAEGMNLFYGANESGKTSIAAFIRAMLYGLGRRSANLEKNPRQRYTPWQSAERMGGSIRFELRGQQYFLERSFGGVKSEDEVRLFNESTYEDIPLKNPEAPAEELLGIAEYDFVHNVFMQRPKLQDYGGVLNSNLLRLQESGTEQSSYSEIKADLDHEARQLKGGRDKGQIGVLSRELDDMYEAYAQALERDEQKSFRLERLDLLDEQLSAVNLQKELSQLQDAKAALEDKIKELSAYQTLQREVQVINQDAISKFPYAMKAVPVRELSKLSQSGRRFADAIRERDLVQAEINKIKAKEGALALQLFKQREEFAQVRKTEHSLQEQLINFPRPKAARKSLFLIVLMLGLLFSVILSILTYQMKTYLFPCAGLIMTVISIVLAYLFWQKEKRETQIRKEQFTQRRNLEKQRRESYERRQRMGWHIEQLEKELEAYREELQTVAKKLQEADFNIRQAEHELRGFLRPWFKVFPKNTNLLELLEVLREFSLEYQDQALAEERLKKYDKFSGAEDISSLHSELRDIEERIKAFNPGNKSLASKFSAMSSEELTEEEIRLRESVAEEKAELKFLDGQITDTANLERKIMQKQGERVKLEEAYLINCLAQGILSLAQERYKKKAQPALHNRAESILRELSGDKYAKLQISSSGSLAVYSERDERFHEDAYFSSGTRDLIHLAYRLALAEMTEENVLLSMPLILDDSLVYLDSKRLNTALQVLTRYSQEHERQIILLSSRPEIKNFPHKELTSF